MTQSQRTPVKLPFSLSSLTLASHEIKTDWVVTGDLLSPVVRNLLSLDLSHFFFPRFESDLFFCLGPAAKNLQMLFLPILVLNPSTYRLALLALCATSLRILRITLASPVLLREILPLFASSPIHTFSLVLFSGIAEPPLITEDPITARQQGLSTWAAATSEQKKRGKSLSVRLGGITNIMGVHRRMGPVFESKGWQGLVFPSLEMKQMMDELVRLFLPFSLPPSHLPPAPPPSVNALQKTSADSPPPFAKSNRSGETGRAVLFVGGDDREDHQNGRDAQDGRHAPSRCRASLPDAHVEQGEGEDGLKSDEGEGEWVDLRRDETLCTLSILQLDIEAWRKARDGVES